MAAGGKNAGQVLINLGQLVFGSLVLGTTIKGAVDQYLLLGVGVISAILLLIFGIWLVSKNSKVKEE